MLDDPCPPTILVPRTADVKRQIATPAICWRPCSVLVHWPNDVSHFGTLFAPSTRMASANRGGRLLSHVRPATGSIRVRLSVRSVPPPRTARGSSEPEWCEHQRSEHQRFGSVATRQAGATAVDCHQPEIFEFEIVSALDGLPAALRFGAVPTRPATSLRRLDGRPRVAPGPSPGWAGRLDSASRQARGDRMDPGTLLVLVQPQRGESVRVPAQTSPCGVGVSPVPTRFRLRLRGFRVGQPACSRFVYYKNYVLIANIPLRTNPNPHKAPYGL
jgi:hypothetical protein